MNRDPKSLETSSTVKFANKMMQFFQVMRDECHDFLLQYEEGQEYSSKSLNHQIGVTTLIQAPKQNHKNNKIMKSIVKSNSESENLVGKEKDRKENKIKKPISAFLMYYSENYHRIAQKYPGNRFKEMMSIVNQEWKLLSKEEKEPYEKRYELSRLRYAQEIVNQPNIVNKDSDDKLETIIEPTKKKINRKQKRPDINEDLKSIGSMDSLDFQSDLRELKIKINDEKK